MTSIMRELSNGVRSNVCLVGCQMMVLTRLKGAAVAKTQSLWIEFSAMVQKSSVVLFVPALIRIESSSFAEMLQLLICPLNVLGAVSINMVPRLLRSAMLSKSSVSPLKDPPPMMSPPAIFASTVLQGTPCGQVRAPGG